MRCSKPNSKFSGQWASKGYRAEAQVCRSQAQARFTRPQNEAELEETEGNLKNLREVPHFIHFLRQRGGVVQLIYEGRLEIFPSPTARRFLSLRFISASFFLHFPSFLAGVRHFLRRGGRRLADFENKGD